MEILNDKLIKCTLSSHFVVKGHTITIAPCFLSRQRTMCTKLQVTSRVATCLLNPQRNTNRIPSKLLKLAEVHIHNEEIAATGCDSTMQVINFVIHRSRSFKLNQVGESAYRAGNRVEVRRGSQGRLGGALM